MLHLLLLHYIRFAQRAAHVLSKPLADACRMVTVIARQHFGFAAVFVWVKADGAAFRELSLLILRDRK